MRKLALTILSSFFLVLAGCGGGGGGDGDGGLNTNACGVLGLETRIVNGSECVDSGSAVVQISLVTTSGALSACSGTMLNSTHVLTAAHCFIFDRVASAGIEANARSIPGTQVFIHPDAVVNEDALAVFNDVAILKLAQSANLPTLPLLLSRTVAQDDIVSIFGYGIDEDGTLGILRSGEMRVTEITPNHIFSKFNGDGSNTCRGDSGGPAIYSFTGPAGTELSGIVGITSSGSIENCSKGDLSLFANVQNNSILQFIMDIVPDVGVI